MRTLDLRASLERLEIFIVDDASTDNSLDIARRLSEQHPEIAVLCHKINLGKGAALRTGFSHASCEFVAIQDADLEYDPNDLLELLVPLADGRADAVYGSRFIGGRPHRTLFFWHYVGNRLLTFLSNILTDLNLTDMETCYKVFRRDILQGITLEEPRFGFEPEVTAKLAKIGARIYEMGISYSGRTYREGKKITWVDGLHAIVCIIKYNVSLAPLVITAILAMTLGAVFLLLFK